MIKVFEKQLLDDEFIIKQFTSNISLNEKDESLLKIKKKIIRNKKKIINAIENGVKFIICGNSCEIFNNSFDHKGLNLFTCYNPNNFKKKIKGIKIKEKYKDNKIKKVDNIKTAIPSENFLYKNLLCIKNEKIIENIL